MLLVVDICRGIRKLFGALEALLLEDFWVGGCYMWCLYDIQRFIAVEQLR